MSVLKRKLLIIVILGVVSINLNYQGVSSGVEVATSSWQQGSHGLSVFNNDEKKTASLGIIVKAESWPRLSMHGGVKDTGHGAIAGPIGIDLGMIVIPGGISAALASESLDWSRNELTFNMGSGQQLKIWASRLSAGLLLQSPANGLRLFTGDVEGNKYEAGKVTARAKSPAYPKYVGYVQGGTQRVAALGASSIPLSMDQNWLLLWYGKSSHFVDSKAPLTYTGYEWATSTLPHGEAYQADIPFLIVFQNKPSSIKHASGGGVEVTFSGAAGYVNIMPLDGRKYYAADATELWSNGLPAEIPQKAQWWAGRMCDFPAGASESYSYEQASDIAVITESISFINLCTGGIRFAPLPPILAIAKDALNVQFSGQVIDGKLATEFGPIFGIENVQTYSWRVPGLKKYIDSRRIVLDVNEPPADLEQALVSEVDKIRAAGHLAPWVFSDAIPRHDNRGLIYWLNPGDVLYHLSEVASALPADKRGQLIEYMKSERFAYPPETVFNLPLDQGKKRSSFALAGQDIYRRWQETKSNIFLKRVPLSNLFALSKYYELTREAISSQVWQRAEDALIQDLRDQDWATFYWFQGYENRQIAVINANREFAGLIGFARLAKLAGDTEAENLGRALFAKAAVQRLGMAKFPRYLYAAGLVQLPSDPSWQVQYTAGRWNGYLFSYEWRGPLDDARQVISLNQFGVYLHDTYGSLGTGYLIAFEGLIPELGRFLSDYALADVIITIKKVESIFPHWYAAFAEGMLGQEHNLAYPSDAYQMFMAKSLITGENQDNLVGYVDIPWLQEGDLFYMHKLAEVIVGHKGVKWQD